MENNEIVFSAVGLEKKYKNGDDEIYALNKVSIDLYKGEILAIMGASGSGKTTLLNVLGALDSPSAGKIFVNGKEKVNYHKEPYATKYRSENIGFIFQSYNLMKDLTVEDNLALPLVLMNRTKDEIKNKVEEHLKLVGLENRAKHRPIELSGGQQQRVAIARALITSPPVLLADELTGNLDFTTSLEILNVLKTLNNSIQQSIILVTHDPNVANFADRVIFLHDGKLVDEHINKSATNNISDILLKMESVNR